MRSVAQFGQRACLGNRRPQVQILPFRLRYLVGRPGRRRDQLPVKQPPSRYGGSSPSRPIAEKKRKIMRSCSSVAERSSHTRIRAGSSPARTIGSGFAAVVQSVRILACHAGDVGSIPACRFGKIHARGVGGNFPVCCHAGEHAFKSRRARLSGGRTGRCSTTVAAPLS